MKTTSTPTSPFLLFLCFFWGLLLVNLQGLQAQGNGNNAVPVFTVNLTGQPNGIWNSGDIDRNGTICGADQNENCVQFTITLDKNAGGLEFSIVGGPVPSGSMAYKINCGPAVPVGQPICVSGTGPHILTICMPGSAKNSFQVKSIAAFNPQADIYVSGGCFALLKAPIAFEESSITWRDITGGGAYNKYLSCTSGCATPTVTPDNNAPAFVDYVVCGQSMASPCSTLPYCDTVRVYFSPAPVVSISPEPSIICPGSTGVELTGTVTGGIGPFSYFWTDRAGTLLGTAQKFTATTTGEYFLEVRTRNYPNCSKFSASTTVVTNLSANAGPDQLACLYNTVSLAGSVNAATGAIWSGGGGTFSPSNTSLTAVYTPTATELQAGSVKLTLTSTGNGSCQAVKDEVVITFYKLEVTLSGPAAICTGSTATLSAAATGGVGTISYRWNTGETTASISNKPAGTYTVTVTDANNCAVQKSFTITEKPGPSDLTLALTRSTCGGSNGSIAINGVTGGTAPYTFSRNGTTYQTVSSFTGLAANTYTVYVKDANGCIYSETLLLQDSPGPTGFTTALKATTCGASNGTIDITGVTSRTLPYTYSINGQSFQASASFSGLPAGAHSLTAKDANGCTFSKTVTLENLAGPTSFTTTVTASACGASNGSIGVTAVTGGAAPFVYSKNGTDFQSSATLSGLLAGNYSITVKDANGCTVVQALAVGNQAGPTNMTASATSSTCGNGNGTLEISLVTGGKAPYTYSLGGAAFQSSATFASLAAGTYALTAKDANGCTVTKSFSVSNLAGPFDFSAAARPSTCGNPNGEISITGVTGGTAPFTYSRNGTTFQSSTSFNALVSGTYTIWVKDASGCLFSKTVNVANLAGPSALILTPNGTTCGNVNGSLVVSSVNGGTAPFSYSKDGTTYQASTTFTGLAVGTYTITAKDANGCLVSGQATLSNTGGPSDLAAAIKASTCGNSNGELKVTGTTGGTAPFTYSRDGINFQANNTFAALAAGSYTLTVRDANGCTVAKPFAVSNISGPTAISASSLAASCLDNDGSISVGGVTGGTAPYSFSINGVAFQSASTFPSLAAGMYTLTAKDANGCLASTLVSVTKDVPTAFNNSTVASTCGNSNGSIIITSVTGGTSPYTYSKNGTTFQTSATFTGLAAGSHTLTVKDAKGCLVARQVTLSNITGPSDFAFTLKASTCGNANGEVTLASVTGGTAPFTYSKNGGTFQASATFLNLMAGTYTFAVKDANGCSFEKQVAVTSQTGPTEATAQAQPSSCGRSNGTVTVTAVTGGAAPYTYSKDGSTFQTSSTFGSLLAGTYAITIQDANGCLYTEQIEIKNINGPTALNLAASSSTCGNSNGSVSIKGVENGTAPYTFALDGITFQNTSSFGNLAAREYTITVKDANGCTYAQKITVTNIAGIQDVLASTSSSTCGSSNGSLTVNGVTGGTAPYVYSKNGVNFQASSTFGSLAAGPHTITVKDANGCLLSKSFTVGNIAGPTAVAASSLPASCLNTDGSILAGTVTGGTAPYTYSLNGTTFQAGSTFSGLASGTYTLTAKDANGCLVPRTVAVGKNVPTDFVITSETASCGGSNGSLTVSTVTGGTGPYVYSKDGISFQASATFTGLSAGNYTLVVKDAKGCTFSKTGGVSNIPGASFVASASSTTCGASNGTISISNVSGGVAPYTFRKDEGAYQTTAFFGNVPAGTYLLTVKDANGCLSSQSVTVQDIAGPADVMLTAKASTCGAANGTITVLAATGGSAPFQYSKDGTSFQTSATFASLLSGTYTITLKDANGCLFPKQVIVDNVAGPTDLAFVADPSTCGTPNGSLLISGVTGGTAPYSFSLNGGAFQANASFETIVAGTYAVTVKDANGCVYTKSVEVENISGPTALAVASTASTCGASNGELTITGVSNGTAPYTYSRDGVNFQASALMTALPAGNHTITVKDANGCVFSKAFTVGNTAGPSAVAASSVPASCADNDGSIAVGNVTGGNAPYTYSLNGTPFQAGTSFTTLSAGTYTLTVKDANGCQVSAAVSVAKNVPAAFTSSSVSSTCGSTNGSITVVSVSGGTAPYTYSKDGLMFQASATLTGFASGAHAITVKDAKGCTYTAQVQVSDVTGPTEVLATLTASTCGNSNGQLSVSNVMGGTGPFTYRLNNGSFQTSGSFTALSAAEYEVSVKDANGCIFTKRFSLTNVAGPSAMTVTTLPASCQNNDGSATVSRVTGGTAPFTYSVNGTTFQASGTLTGLAAGTYTVVAKDANGCLVSVAAQISTNIPQAFVSTITASTCGKSNGSVTVTEITGGTAPYTYSKNGTSFQTSSTLSGLLAGAHTITVKDARGCVINAQVQVTDVAGPTDFTSSFKSSTCGSANGALTVTSVDGGTSAYTYSLNGSAFQADHTFNAVVAGEYQVRVKDANGCIFSKTIVVPNIAGPSFTSITEPSTCGADNGTITLVPAGGTAPLTFSRDGVTFQAETSFTSLLAGNYTFTVKDANGCTYSASVSLGTIAGPADLTLASTASTCGAADGKIDINGVKGGVAPYSFALNNLTFLTQTSFNLLGAGEYTVTVKDANGCTFAKKITVTDKAGPTDLTALIKLSTCGNSNGELTVNGLTGGTGPFTYSLDGTTFQSSATFAGLVASTYLTWVKDANGCSFSKEVVLGNSAGPSAFTATSQTASCSRNNGSLEITQVSGGTAPYTYSKNGSTFQSSASFSGLLSGTYTITVKDANGCFSAKEVSIGEVAGPADLTLASVASTCGASNGSITVNGVSGGIAPYTFSLDAISFQTSSTFGQVLAGEHTLTVKDANGCTFAKKITVGNVAGPAAFAAVTTATTCGASNGRLTVNSVSGGTAPFTYSLNGVDFQASGTFQALAGGSQTVTVKDANGCTFSREVILDNLAGPASVSVSSQPSSCLNNDGSFTVGAVEGGTAPYTYSLNGVDFQNGTSFDKLAAGAYTITVKDANGCTFAQAFKVANVASPSAVATSEKPAGCADNDGSLTVGTVTGGTAPYAYSLQEGVFQTSTTFSGLASGSYTLTVKDANGCLLTTAVTIGKNAPTGLVLTASHATCGNDNGTVSVGTVMGGKAPFQYSLDGVSFQSNSSFTGLAGGTYTVTVKDANGCTFSDKTQVAASSGITDLTFSTTASNCQSKTGSLTVSSVTGGTAPHAYSLDGTTFQTTVGFSNLAEGRFTLTVKDAKGCQFTKEVVITSNSAITGLGFSTTLASCGQSSGSIKIGEVTGGTAPYVYSLDGTTFSGSTTREGLAAGTYPLTVKDVNNCTYVVQVQVGAVQSEVAKITHITCVGEANGRLEISTSGTPEQLEFSINNGATFQKDSVFQNLPAGRYQVLTRISATCTLSLGTVEVKEPKAILLSVTPLVKTREGEKAGLAAVTAISGGTAPYTYQLNKGIFSADSVFRDLGSGTHWLLVKDQNGCSIEISFSIETNTGLEIPTGFTPNGDGMNDVWVLKNLATLYPACKVTVYNRWGIPVFESNGYQTPWDGTHKGGELPVGTYYTIIDLGNGEPALKKSVTIMR